MARTKALCEGVSRTSRVDRTRCVARTPRATYELCLSCETNRLPQNRAHRRRHGIIRLLHLVVGVPSLVQRVTGQSSAQSCRRGELAQRQQAERKADLREIIQPSGRKGHPARTGIDGRRRPPDMYAEKANPSGGSKDHKSITLCFGTRLCSNTTWQTALHFFLRRSRVPLPQPPPLTPFSPQPTPPIQNRH